MRQFRVPRLALLAGAVALAAPLPVLRAQEVSIAGGASMTRGPLSSRADVGRHAQASLGIGGDARALGLRLDALYSQFPGERFTVPVTGERGRAMTQRTYAVAGAAVLRGPTLAAGIRPYGLVGLGLHGQNTYTGFNVGLNAGGGLAFPLGPLHAFVEARAHRFRLDARLSPTYDRSVTFVPLSLGLRF